jgi:hypothetical protein
MISGSGRRYGFSSILFPNLKQSSNLDLVSFRNCIFKANRDLPVRKHDLAFELLVESRLALWMV